MSGLFGGKTQGQGNVLAGVQLQTSCYGNAIALAYGTARVPGNLLDYDDFITYPNKQSVGKGGVTTYNYTYSAGALLALCEGPISTVGRVWSQQAVNTVPYYGLTLFNGTRPQSPWSVWASKHPGKAVGYSGIAYACSDAFNLDASGSMPNFSFEVVALLATEQDLGSTITLGLGDSTNHNFQLLDPNGNPISDTTTPPLAGYISPVYFVNGIALSSGITVGKIGATYYLQFTTAPANGAVVAWSTSLVAADAKPSAVLVDFLTSNLHGAGWDPVRIADLVTGPSSWQTYCTAMGFAVSPVYDSQKTAAEHIAELLAATNSEAVWTASNPGQMVLNVIPYGDTPVTGNGAAYVPNLTIQANLTYDDFLGVVDAGGAPTGNDPVTCTRTSPADTYNTIPCEFCDRQNAYNTATVQDPEPVDVAITGTRAGSALSLHLITRRAHALAISRLGAQRSILIRNTYSFILGWRWIRLEPMDFVTLTDAKLGLNQAVVRIISVDFPEKASEANGITFTAEAWPLGVGTPTLYASQPATNSGNNNSVDPGLANAPVFLDLPPLMWTDGNPEVMIATSGGPQWGGCNVWVSEDGSTYLNIGTISNPCTYGTLTAALASAAGTDSTHTLAVQLTSGQLGSTSAQGALDLLDPVWASGEVMAFQTATLTGLLAYNLTTLQRGAFGTAPTSHSIGDSFVRLDGTPLVYEVPASRIGQTLYFKLQSYNQWGRGLQDLSTLPVYSYTPGSPSYPQPSGVVFSVGSSNPAPAGIQVVDITQPVAVVSGNGSIYQKSWLTISWSLVAGVPNPDHFEIVVFTGLDPTAVAAYLVSPVETMDGTAREIVISVAPVSTLPTVNVAVRSVYA